MGRSPYVADLGYRRGSPRRVAHPHRCEVQPPASSTSGRIVQPSHGPGKGVVNGVIEPRDLLGARAAR